MNLTRRQLLAGSSLLTLGSLAGCDKGYFLDFKYGKNLSPEWIGNQLNLKTTQGTVRKMSDYWWMMPMIFFGFTQCPAVCPTTLARAVQIKRLMGTVGDRLQVVFITLDPERDTPQVLEKYVKTFDPSFEALTGTPEEIAATAKAFKVFYEKIPEGDSYTISHSSTSYVADSRGNFRLSLAHRLTAQECTEDLLTLMEIC